MRNVIIVQRVLPHYRIEFFKQLRESLLDSGVSLTLMYGQQKPGTVPETVKVEYEWAHFISNSYFNVLNTELVYQKLPRLLKESDLIIVEQANRLLVNYRLLFLRMLGNIKLAYWGHGRNLQSPEALNIKEKVKRKLMKSVDWWFVYTRLSATIVSAAGYPNKRITVVENSINTDEFKHALDSVTSGKLNLIREHLGLGAGPVALYCGGMYPDKKLLFLLEAVEMIRDEITDFNFILIGSGPDEILAQRAAKKYPWVHYIGSVYGQERAVYFSLSDVMLMPGLVGLAIVDSFVAGLPIITTDIPIHSPEIAYLENNVNGIMTAHLLKDYVAATIDVLSDNECLSRLREGCSVSASRYTLGAMVENFSAGIFDCLGIDAV